MKTLYYCEICNKSFENEADCAKHESLCHELHDKGFEIAQKLNAVFDEARKLNVKMEFEYNKKANYNYNNSWVTIETIRN